MLILEFFSRKLSPVIFLPGFDFVSVSILILLLICTRLLLTNKSSFNKSSPNKLSPAFSFTKSSKYFYIDFWYANFCCCVEVNIGIFELLLFRERGTNSGENDFLCSALTYLVVLIATTFNNLFDVGIIETLVIASLTILYLNMGYWMQTSLHKFYIARKVFGKKDLYDEGCEDKKKCDLHSKWVEDKKDADLCIGCETRDEMV